MEYRKMNRTTVFDKTVQSIKESILAGEIKPGDRLPSEGRLASMMGIGRGTVREALQVLIHLGLLVRSNKVTSVAPDALESLKMRGLSDAVQKHGDLMEMIELRKILEPEAVAMAAERVSGQDLEQIERQYRLMLDTRQDLERFIEHDNQFHAEILRASGNRLIAEILQRIQEPMRRSQAEVLHGRQMILPRSVSYHEQILRALKDHDRAAARKYMLRHLMDIEKEIHAILRADS